MPEILDAYDIYTRFVSVSLTYKQNNKYDFFTYGGKVTATKESFLKRKDRQHYYMLGKKLDGDIEKVTDYIFLALFYKPTTWISELLSEEKMIMSEIIDGYRENFLDEFRKECIGMKQVMEKSGYSFNDMLRCGKNPPKLMELLYIETLSPFFFAGINIVYDRTLYRNWQKSSDIFKPILDKPLWRLGKVIARIETQYRNQLTKQKLHDIMRKIFIGKG